MTTAQRALTMDGARLRDPAGRHRILHGINLVAKGHRDTGVGGTFIERGFAGEWTAADIADLAARGFTLIRLGVIWAAVEPEPGIYDEDYLDWIGDQLDLIRSSGMMVLLDAHQDLYSQAFGDGAPRWATLTDEPFDETELWSDAYLISPAVHEALDKFWANAPGPGGVGLQDRFAAMWGHVAARFGSHPAVIGYDLLNEPTPGSASPQIFESLIIAFGAATGQDPMQIMADFMAPAAKLEQLARLDDELVHRAIGDAVSPAIAAFERDSVAPFMARAAASIRQHDDSGILAREHSYFANLGIPSGQPALDDPAWVYSPHGYDLTVDTEAIALSSNTRAGTIFARHAETATRLGAPVIVGEWGALDLGPGVADHGTFLQDVFDRYGWSWTYWCWQPGFASSEAAVALTRPRPVAFAGDGESWQVTDGTLTARWVGKHLAEPSVFYLPAGEATVTRDGEPAATTIDGRWVRVAPGVGEFTLVGR